MNNDALSKQKNITNNVSTEAITIAAKTRTITSENTTTTETNFNNNEFKKEHSSTQSAAKQHQNLLLSNHLPEYQHNVGSATGNPRNKCALKPGHSLMDWIRLGSSGCDLAGTKGLITPVSHAELSKHCKLNDAWLAIRGKVYNVTKYMDFHPGGFDELMKGIGKDATKLFDEVHAWVNYEQLLAKCFIGPLRNTATINLNTNNRLAKIPSPTNGGIFRTPILPFLNTTIGKPMSKIIPTSSSSSSSSSITSTYPTALTTISNDKIEIIPRFDWIQKTTDLIIIFYTKSLCNPGISVHYKDGCDIDINIFIDRTMHICTFKFAHYVNWPCLFRISNETGKIEIIFKKTEPALWKNFGLLDRRKTTDLLNKLLIKNYEYNIINREQITHNSYAVILKSKENIQEIFPIGYHISVTATIQGIDITRSYTPIPYSYLPVALQQRQQQQLLDCYKTATIPFLIKTYSSGNLSTIITNENPFVSISHPKGNFSLQNIKNHTRIGILAAGSGVTPMLSILDYLLGRSINKLEIINFLYFNKTESDIWCRQYLDLLMEQDKRLSVMHILSEPSSAWTGEIGRISLEITSKLSGNTFTSDSSSSVTINAVTYCCICGPTSFNELCLKLLKESGFSDNDLHTFQG